MIPIFTNPYKTEKSVTTTHITQGLSLSHYQANALSPLKVALECPLLHKLASSPITYIKIEEGIKRIARFFLPALPGASKTILRVLLLSLLCCLQLAATAGTFTKMNSGPTQLQAGFKATAQHGCVPLTLSFEALNKKTGWYYTWNFGNGNTYTGSRTANTCFENPGTYIVKLMVGDGTETDSSFMQIVVFGDQSAADTIFNEDKPEQK